MRRLFRFLPILLLAGCTGDRELSPAEPAPSDGPALVGDGVWPAKELVPTWALAIPPQRCVGAVGSQCDPVPALGLTGVRADGVGWVSVGSILHDNCCIENYPNGYWCNNHGKDQSICRSEWDKATRNRLNMRQWLDRFTGQPDDTSRVAARRSSPSSLFETAATARLQAPDGTRLDRTDFEFCADKAFRETAEQLAQQDWGTCGCGINGQWEITGSETLCYQGHCIRQEGLWTSVYACDERSTSLRGRRFVGRRTWKDGSSAAMQGRVDYELLNAPARANVTGTWTFPVFTGSECGGRVYRYVTLGFEGTQDGCTLHLRWAGPFPFYTAKTCAYTGMGSLEGTFTMVRRNAAASKATWGIAGEGDASVPYAASPPLVKGETAGYRPYSFAR